MNQGYPPKNYYIIIIIVFIHIGHKFIATLTVHGLDNIWTVPRLMRFSTAQTAIELRQICYHKYLFIYIHTHKYLWYTSTYSLKSSNNNDDNNNICIYIYRSNDNM